LGLELWVVEEAEPPEWFADRAESFSEN